MKQNKDWRENLAEFGCPRNYAELTIQNDSWFAETEVEKGWWMNDPCCPGSNSSDFDFCTGCEMNNGATFCIQSIPKTIEETFVINGKLQHQKTIISNQCCYDDEGNLLSNSSEGAGTAKRSINNKDHLFNFFLTEFSFFKSCCTDETQCEAYYLRRPPLIGQYSPPRRAMSIGGSRFQSLDGFEYRFNGLGVYTMLELSNSGKFETTDFVMQISTRLAGQATVFSGFVAADSFTY